LRRLEDLFERNRSWVEQVLREDPDFFARLSKQQAPKYLWIGCSDSRVPANEIIGLPPGEVFVHRNIANIVHSSDMNCLAVIHFAVEILDVRDIIVCGHYGCGGILAAVKENDLGLIDNWLEPIRRVANRSFGDLSGIGENEPMLRRLCELSVVEQVSNVCRTTIVQRAWKHGKTLSVHGWIYDVGDGRLRDLDLCVTGAKEATEIHHRPAFPQ